MFKISSHTYKTIVFLALLIFPILTYGQILDTEIPNVISDSIKKNKIKVIPLTHIIEGIEITNKELKSIQKKINKDTKITEIDSLFPFYEEFLKIQKEEVDKFLKADPNREKIDNLIIKWDGYSEYLEIWQTEINDFQERNSRLYETIEPSETIWNLTYDNALEENAPPEILNNIVAIRDSVVKLKDIILKNNNDFLSMEARINVELNEIDEVIEELTSLKDSDVYNLFNQRLTPVWTTSFSNIWEHSGTNNIDTVKMSTLGNFDFVKTLKRSLPLFLIFVALITLLVLYLKKAFETYPFTEENADLQHAKSTLTEHYLATIFFLVFLLARFYFVPAPKLFLDILTLFSLFSAIALVKPLMYKRFKKLIYFAIFFYVFDSIKTYVWFNAEQYRLYTFIEAILVIVVVFSFTHPYRETLKMKMEIFGKFLLRFTPLIYVLCGASILANILGYINLTDLSLKISTRSGVFIILFYALLIISNSLFLSIIHRHFSVQSSFDPDHKLQTEKKVLKFNRVTVIIIWSLVFLKMIDQLAPILTFFTDTSSEPYKFGNLTFTLNEVVSFLLVLFISFALTRIVSFLINDGQGILRVFKFPKGIPAAISLVIRYLIIAFGIILALSSLGIDLSKFNLMAGALGLGIGFGLQTVISNFVSGLILVFERPILQGDTVEVDNLLGTVNRIGVRSSSITTFEGAEVIVPNNNLISNDLINWTLSNNTKRVEILVGTSYSSDPNLVLKILYEAASNYEDTLKNPPPQALFVDFGDNSLNFTLRFWVHYELWLQAKSDVSIEVYNQFKDAGIEIPFPQRDLHIKNIPEIVSNYKTPPPHDPPESETNMDDTEIPKVVIPIEHRDPGHDLEVEEKESEANENQEPNNDNQETQ
ncbi:mechanosensitive ion channel family protein [Mangrovimonas sp. YM274]|uniref:mechanosensitive ion channel family protein n=1 Tax=Mangrovimonas sp. YM274 TaxID=3070660 RepID=UPI0027DE4DDB|nr:mechanosensitive ion channel domain-containing protein [Mangrovimonas sp. YM274]WMI68028.1 mechanosensitive ion channel [Mangrovimonas sp. YM274]